SPSFHPASTQQQTPPRQPGPPHHPHAAGPCQASHSGAGWDLRRHASAGRSRAGTALGSSKSWLAPAAATTSNLQRSTSLGPSRPGGGTASSSPGGATPHPLPSQPKSRERSPAADATHPTHYPSPNPAPAHRTAGTPWQTRHASPGSQGDGAAGGGALSSRRPGGQAAEGRPRSTSAGTDSRHSAAPARRPSSTSQARKAHGASQQVAPRTQQREQAAAEAARKLQLRRAVGRQVEQEWEAAANAVREQMMTQSAAAAFEARAHSPPGLPAADLGQAHTVSSFPAARSTSPVASVQGRGQGLGLGLSSGPSSEAWAAVRTFAAEVQQGTTGGGAGSPGKPGPGPGQPDPPAPAQPVQQQARGRRYEHPARSLATSLPEGTWCAPPQPQPSAAPAPAAPEASGGREERGGPSRQGAGSPLRVSPARQAHTSLSSQALLQLRERTRQLQHSIIAQQQQQQQLVPPQAPPWLPLPPSLPATMPGGHSSSSGGSGTGAQPAPLLTSVLLPPPPPPPPPHYTNHASVTSAWPQTWVPQAAAVHHSPPPEPQDLPPTLMDGHVGQAGQTDPGLRIRTPHPSMPGWVVRPHPLSPQASAETNWPVDSSRGPAPLSAPPSALPSAAVAAGQGSTASMPGWAGGGSMVHQTPSAPPVRNPEISLSGAVLQLPPSSQTQSHSVPSHLPGVTQGLGSHLGGAAAAWHGLAPQVGAATPQQASGSVTQVSSCPAQQQALTALTASQLQSSIPTPYTGTPPPPTLFPLNVALAPNHHPNHQQLNCSHHPLVVVSMPYYVYVSSNEHLTNLWGGSTAPAPTPAPSSPHPPPWLAAAAAARPGGSHPSLHAHAALALGLPPRPKAHLALFMQAQLPEPQTRVWELPSPTTATTSVTFTTHPSPRGSPRPQHSSAARDLLLQLEQQQGRAGGQQQGWRQQPPPLPQQQRQHVAHFHSSSEVPGAAGLGRQGEQQVPAAASAPLTAEAAAAQGQQRVVVEEQHVHVHVYGPGSQVGSPVPPCSPTHHQGGAVPATFTTQGHHHQAAPSPTSASHSQQGCMASTQDSQQPPPQPDLRSLHPPPGAPAAPPWPQVAASPLIADPSSSSIPHLGRSSPGLRARALLTNSLRLLQPPPPATGSHAAAPDDDPGPTAADRPHSSDPGRGFESQGVQLLDSFLQHLRRQPGGQQTLQEEVAQQHESLGDQHSSIQRSRSAARPARPDFLQSMGGQGGDGVGSRKEAGEASRGRPLSAGAGDSSTGHPGRQESKLEQPWPQALLPRAQQRSGVQVSSVGAGGGGAGQQLREAEAWGEAVAMMPVLALQEDLAQQLESLDDPSMAHHHPLNTACQLLSKARADQVALHMPSEADEGLRWQSTTAYVPGKEPRDGRLYDQPQEVEGQLLDLMLEREALEKALLAEQGKVMATRQELQQQADAADVLESALIDTRQRLHTMELALTSQTTELGESHEELEALRQQEAQLMAAQQQLAQQLQAAQEELASMVNELARREVEAQKERQAAEDERVRVQACEAAADAHALRALTLRVFRRLRGASRTQRAIKRLAAAAADMAGRGLQCRALKAWRSTTETGGAIKQLQARAAVRMRRDAFETWREHHLSLQKSHSDVRVASEHHRIALCRAVLRSFLQAVACLNAAVEAADAGVTARAEAFAARCVLHRVYSAWAAHHRQVAIPKASVTLCGAQATEAPCPVLEALGRLNGGCRTREAWRGAGDRALCPQHAGQDVLVLVKGCRFGGRGPCASARGVGVSAPGAGELARMIASPRAWWSLCETATRVRQTTAAAFTEAFLVTAARTSVSRCINAWRLVVLSRKAGEAQTACAQAESAAHQAQGALLLANDEKQRLLTALDSATQQLEQLPGLQAGLQETSLQLAASEAREADLQEQLHCTVQERDTLLQSTQQLTQTSAAQHTELEELRSTLASLQLSLTASHNTTRDLQLRLSQQVVAAERAQHAATEQLSSQARELASAQAAVQRAQLGASTHAAEVKRLRSGWEAEVAELVGQLRAKDAQLELLSQMQGLQSGHSSLGAMALGSTPRLPWQVQQVQGQVPDEALTQRQHSLQHTKQQRGQQGQQQVARTVLGAKERQASEAAQEGSITSFMAATLQHLAGETVPQCCPASPGMG
ncbi:hypothetical protein QJQ45_024150, partial [Haematococcus lacustris]